MEKALILNSAIGGLPVEVMGGNSLDDGYPKTYVFAGMVLPGSWRQTPFEGVGDLELRHMDADGRPRAGSTRVLSASLVRRFTVVGEGFRYCFACGRPLRRTEKVHDVGGLGNYVLPDGEFEWESRFECGDCW